MAKRKVFYSFHFANDALRVQQIRNMGKLEGNEPVNHNTWETVKKGGETAVKKWIDDNLRHQDCIIVLIGSDTANREFVKYEIEKAWTAGKPIFGIYIHNLKCPNKGTCAKGGNPFSQFTVTSTGANLSTLVTCYDPGTYGPYKEIEKNLEVWVETAIKNNKR
jgi:hypothetical protein